MEVVKRGKERTKQPKSFARVEESLIDLNAVPQPITLDELVNDEDAKDPLKTDEAEFKDEQKIVDDRFSVSNSAAEKDSEDRQSSSFVRELPLEALFSRTNSRDDTRQVESLGEEKEGSADVDDKMNELRPNSSSAMDLLSIPADVQTTQVKIIQRPVSVVLPTICVEKEKLYNEVDANRQQNMYPKLNMDGEASAPPHLSTLESETTLLSEAQLLEFYKNDQLDFVDDFTDVFVQAEIEPRYFMYDLLLKYKMICEDLEEISEIKSKSAKVLSTLINEVWEIESRKVVQQGRCQCGRSANGDASYNVATLRAEKLVALNEELVRLNNSELNVGFCLEIRSRALALQIQWIIVDVNNKFFNEHQLSSSSLPILMPVTHSLSSRVLLKRALSELFYFVRFPALPNRFRNSITGWISELGAALLKACTPDDQLFFMSHILRCPSPLGTWAIGLIQTYISTPNFNLSVLVDSYVTMISVLLRSVRHREQFLCRVVKFYEGENSWNFVGDDGSMENLNMADLSESDLIAIFSQFSVKPLFSAALKNFTFVHKGNRLQLLLSLISFVLVFLKICDEGIESYLSLRDFCKKICGNIRTLMQCFCNYWDLVRKELTETDQFFIQNEMNRILLQAAYYIVSKNCIDLWQFLVDFPYESVTESCRLRCQLLYRYSSSMTVRDLYEIPDSELVSRIKSSRNLWEQLCDYKKSGKVDATYKVLSLSSVISYCSLEQNFMTFQIIHLCFLDESTRDDYYKVGSEAVALFLERSPNFLPSLLKYIDRHVDHLDVYAVDILTNASKALRNCRISADDVSNLLGKWLINRPIDSPASQIARRILCSMNWGNDNGDLWLPLDVHNSCADTIVKAHIVHCKVQNSMIAKSVSKATKLAMKCSDLEQQFAKFCWEVLIKLKVSTLPMNSPPTTNDMAAFYLFIRQKCLHSAAIFMEHGLKYFIDLVNASSFKACVIILSHLVSNFESTLNVFISNQNFCKCVDQLIHADESAYAVQLIIGTDDFPGPILSLIASTIEFQIYMEESVVKKKKLAHAWLHILTCTKSVEWNTDKLVIYLIGFIAKTAFLFDADTLFDIQKVFENLYKVQYLAWKDSSKSFISWFSSQIHSPIIASDLFGISPWTSYVLLKVEPTLFGAFYEFLDASLCKHPQRSLEEAIKKASSKSHTNFSIDRIHYARWLELSTSKAVIDHEVFPLVLQQLCCSMLERKTYERKKHCCGLRYLQCPTTKSLFDKLKCDVLPKCEKKTDNSKLKSFYHAVSEWIFSEEVYVPEFSRFSDYTFDYLLHMAVAGNQHMWIELLSNHEIRKNTESGMKIFSSCYHLNGIFGASTSPEPSNKNGKINVLTKFFAMLETDSPNNVVPIPLIPLHNGLPLSEKIEPNWYGISPLPLVFSRYLDEVNRTAKTFVSGKENVDALNAKYLDLFQKLYVDIKKNLRIVLRCGNFVKCSHPANIDYPVVASNYDKDVASKMDENRSQREEEISKISLIIDTVAIQCGQLEKISSVLNDYSKMTVYGADGDADFVRTTGVGLFYKICNFVDGVQFLFPAAVQCYESCLNILGKAFIAENPAEQINLMRIVKAGNPLNHFLVAHFTPHCISPELLFQLYSELSHSVRDPNTSEASLALLSRLDIEHSGNRMPVNQFMALMPMIFENIVYVSNASPLRPLCMEHFVHAIFHHFPFNFSTGLKLMLSGLDSQAVPPELFVKVIARFDDFGTILTEPFSVKISQKKMKMTSEQALYCVRIIVEQLNTSRHLHNNRLFTVWSQYLESVCRLAGYFLRLIVYQTFSSDATISVIEKELRDVFYMLVSVWGPLFEPLDTGVTPWGVSENVLASALLDGFVSCMNWLPHSVYMPPGSENIESLFWQYFSTKLINLQRTVTTHVFSVYETKIVRLNWARFWPTLLDLNAIETSVAGSSSELCPLIVEIIVRVPWFQLLQQQRSGANQPIDAQCAFSSLMLSVFAHCVHRNANYAKSRASMESLLKLFLDNAEWHLVKADMVDKVGEFIGNSFPTDLLTVSATNNEILKTFLCIWREACFFSTVRRPVSTTSFSRNSVEEEEADINRKRAVYVRTNMALMLRSSMDREEQKKFYREILSKVNQLITITTDDSKQYLDVARELTAFWTKISKNSNVDVMMRTLTDWLKEHCESVLLLLVMNSAASSLPIPVGLKLLDECIIIYFRRRLSCNWSELLKWLNIPKRSKEWLYTTPKTDSDVLPRFFVLNAQLIADMSMSRSVNEESKILRRIGDYISSIKPKYITNEASFLLCVEKWQRMLIRQFSNGVALASANEELDIYLKWLRKIYLDERSASIFSVMAKFAARKPTFSIKLQIFAHIMDFYISQQLRSVNQPPRLGLDQPVLNSRIQAFNELKQQKQYQEVINSSGIVVNVQPYFAHYNTHNLHHAMDLFMLLVRSLYPDEKFLQSEI